MTNDDVSLTSDEAKEIKTIRENLSELRVQLQAIDGVAVKANDARIGIERLNTWEERAIQALRKLGAEDFAVRLKKVQGPMHIGAIYQNFLNRMKAKDAVLDALDAELASQPRFWLAKFHSSRAPQMVPVIASEKVESSSLDKLFLICAKFHAVARQLRERHASRPTLSVEDEYDVQDLYHALLRMYFDDVRAEEWTPSYAGSSKRMDFLLKTDQIVIEIKKTRQGLGEKEAGDQLLIDIAHYREHPACKTLVCFIYDPEERIRNPQGFKADLERQSSEQMGVVIQISPSR